jgi:hypothetical protein
MSEKRVDGCYFRTVRALHERQFGTARKWIERTMAALDQELKPLIGESYSRAYHVVVKVQQVRSATPCRVTPFRVAYVVVLLMVAYWRVMQSCVPRGGEGAAGA